MLSVLTNFNSDGGADNETGMELDETRSEHLDMLKDNERSERALKSSEKTPKGRNVASSSSKTEKNQQKALSTTKMNGNEKPKKRAEVNIFLSFHGSITKIKSVLIKTNFKFCASTPFTLIIPPTLHGRLRDYIFLTAQLFGCSHP